MQRAHRFGGLPVCHSGRSCCLRVRVSAGDQNRDRQGRPPLLGKPRPVVCRLVSVERELGFEGERELWLRGSGVPPTGPIPVDDAKLQGAIREPAERDAALGS
jgi:hypothetical protein